MHYEMFTASNGDRADAPNIGVVITDGASSVDADRTGHENVILSIGNSEKTTGPGLQNESDNWACKLN